MLLRALLVTLSREIRITSFQRLCDSQYGQSGISTAPWTGHFLVASCLRTSEMCGITGAARSSRSGMGSDNCFSCCMVLLLGEQTYFYYVDKLWIGHWVTVYRSSVSTVENLCITGPLSLLASMCCFLYTPFSPYVHTLFTVITLQILCNYSTICTFPHLHRANSSNKFFKKEIRHCYPHGVW